MASLLPDSSQCCTPCEDVPTTQVPGPEGDAGQDGTDGGNGENAFTVTTANFTVPAEGATVVVSVGSSAWAALLQIVFVQNAGYYQVAAIPGPTSLTLTNLENTGASAYTTNAAPATVISSGSKVGPGGLQGPAGSVVGALLAANNLSDVVSPGTSRTNLGLGTMATQAASAVAITGGAIAGITDLAVADGGTGASNAANARTNLGLVIGTNVQAFDATLQSIAALGTVADRMLYTTGVDTWAEATLTAVARTLLSAATAAAQRQALSVLPKSGLLGSLIGADFNSTADQAITIASGITKYVIRRIVVVNASLNLTTAVGGLYGAAAKSAPNIVANTQVYTALTAAAKFVDLTLTALCGTDIFTQGTIYLSLTTPQGAAATADVFVFGDVVE